MAVFLLIVAVLAFSTTACLAVNCNNDVCTRDGHVNTLCLFPNPLPNRVCGHVLSLGLTKDEQFQLVNAHNQHRQFVALGLEQRGRPGPQPPARNMKAMTWDDELAELAQRWANQCEFRHDACRSVERFYVGQNVGVWITTGNMATTAEDIVHSWYNEVKDMNRNQVARFVDGNLAGHYTQVVWANSVKLGCGKIVFQIGPWKKYYLVCNYGPGGNIINWPVYET